MFALALPAGPHAQDLAPASSAATQLDELIATLVVNGVRHGEFRLARTHEGEIWLRGEDLPQLSLQPRPEAQRIWGGETWYATGCGVLCGLAAAGTVGALDLDGWQLAAAILAFATGCTLAHAAMLGAALGLAVCTGLLMRRRTAWLPAKR